MAAKTKVMNSVLKTPNPKLNLHCQNCKKTKNQISQNEHTLVNKKTVSERPTHLPNNISCILILDVSVIFSTNVSTVISEPLKTCANFN